MQTACAGAVRASDSLTDKAIEKLITDLAQTEMPYTSPRGRPTLIFTSYSELEALFPENELNLAGRDPNWEQLHIDAAHASLARPHVPVLAYIAHAHLHLTKLHSSALTIQTNPPLAPMLRAMLVPIQPLVVDTPPPAIQSLPGSIPESCRIGL